MVYNSLIINMINITVIDRNDTPHLLEVPTDMAFNLMEICKSYELPVEGTCGGMALCASCHCYLESGHHLPEPTDDEWYMLDQTLYVLDNRLGCQIKMTDNLDGLVVRLAPEV
jgi:ferredoxin